MNIIEKLKKLIRHEESARSIGNLEEAKVFADKIQSLLDRHNLDLSDIDIEAAKSSVNKTKSEIRVAHDWQSIFIIKIAEINGCKIVFARHEVTVIGSEDDRLVVIELYKYFEKLGRDLADNELKIWKSTADYRRKRKKIYHSKLFKKSFLHGFVSALIRRFQERHESTLAQAAQSNALIYIGNKLSEADAWMRNNIQLKDSRDIKVAYAKLKTDAYLKGVRAGNSVALTTQTIN